MQLAHKIALNPTHSQERLLWEHVGYARFATNTAIEDFRERLAAGGVALQQDAPPTLERSQGRSRSLGCPSHPERGQERHTQRGQGYIKMGRLQVCNERR